MKQSRYLAVYVFVRPFKKKMKKIEILLAIPLTALYFRAIMKFISHILPKSENGKSK